MFWRKRDPLRELRTIPIEALADGVIMALAEIARRTDLNFKAVVDDLLEAYDTAMEVMEKELLGD